MTEYKIQSSMNENNILFHQIVRGGKPLCGFTEGYPFDYVKERQYLLDAVKEHARRLKNSAIKSVERTVMVEE